MVQTWAAYKRFLFALLVLGNDCNPVQPSTNRNNEQNLWVSHWVRFTRVNLQCAYHRVLASTVFPDLVRLYLIVDVFGWTTTFRWETIYSVLFQLGIAQSAFAFSVIKLATAASLILSLAHVCFCLPLIFWLLNFLKLGWAIGYRPSAPFHVEPRQSSLLLQVWDTCFCFSAARPGYMEIVRGAAIPTLHLEHKINQSSGFSAPAAVLAPQKQKERACASGAP